MKQLLIIILLFTPAIIRAEWKEHIYLTTDKEVYLSGESALISVTTINDRQQPVVFSKVAYIELADSVLSKVQIMARLTTGSGSAILIIPDNLPTGYYRLIAYTRYMLNSEPDIRTEKIIAVVNATTLNRRQLIGGTVSSKETVQPAGIIIGKLKPIYRHREQIELVLSDLPTDLSSYTLSISSTIQGIEPISTLNNIKQPHKVTQNTYLPEYEDHIIRTAVKGTISSNSKVLLSVPGRKPELFAGRKIAEGEYEFITKNIEGITELASTIDTREEERYTIEILSPYAPVVHKQLPVLKIDSACLPAIVGRHVALQVQSAFGQSVYEPGNTVKQTTALKPEWTYILKEYTRFNTLEEVILEYVSNVRFRRIGNIRTLAVNREGQNGYTLGNTLVLLDNVPVFTHELLLKYDADRIEKIEVYRGQYIFGGQLYDGIVSFSSYEGDFRGFQLDRSTLITSYNGPQNGVNLLHPDRSSSTIPDMRTTLLWLTGHKATDQRIRFETSDVSGLFRVHFEGLTSHGTMVRDTGYFKVE